MLWCKYQRKQKEFKWETRPLRTSRKVIGSQTQAPKRVILVVRHLVLSVEGITAGTVEDCFVTPAQVREVLFLPEGSMKRFECVACVH
jgi:hypothetical protein